MRIGFLTSRVPYPLTSGYSVRAYNIIRHLRRSHEVSVYTLGDPLIGGELARQLDVRVRVYHNSVAAATLSVLRGAVGRVPLQVRLYRNKALLSDLSTEIESNNLDILFVHLLRMGEYAKALADIPAIIDATDSLCLSYQRTPVSWKRPFSWAVRFERDRVCQYEACLHRWFRTIFVTSPIDACAMRTRTQSDSITLLPNGVDLEMFRPTNILDKHRIIFSGRLDYLPNTDAAIYYAKTIFPKVRERMPHVRFVIAGSRPPSSVRRLSSIDGIEVLADVPDLGAEVAKSVVSVAPLRFGAGVQNKVLESLAVGTPVICPASVANPITRGITLPFISLAGNDDEYIAAALSMLNAPEASKDLGRQAREWVAANCTWDQALKPLDDVLSSGYSRSGKIVDYIESVKVANQELS